MVEAFPDHIHVVNVTVYQIDKETWMVELRHLLCPFIFIFRKSSKGGGVLPKKKQTATGECQIKLFCAYVASYLSVKLAPFTIK